MPTQKQQQQKSKLKKIQEYCNTSVASRHGIKYETQKKGCPGCIVVPSTYIIMRPVLQQGTRCVF